MTLKMAILPFTKSAIFYFPQISQITQFFSQYLCNQHAFLVLKSGASV